LTPDQIHIQNELETISLKNARQGAKKLIEFLDFFVNCINKDGRRATILNANPASVLGKLKNT